MEWRSSHAAKRSLRRARKERAIACKRTAAIVFVHLSSAAWRLSAGGGSAALKLRNCGRLEQMAVRAALTPTEIHTEANGRPVPSDTKIA